jgi:hypothetical protein
MPFALTAFLALTFAPCMTAPTFATLQILVWGWLHAPHRTVTAMLCACGLSGATHHARFHRLLSQARWSLDAVGLCVFRLAMAWLGEQQTIFLAGDDTLARKKGLKIFGVGMHHDPLLSSRNKAIVNWGHNWVVLAVLVPLPFRREGWFALPILFRLYRSRQSVEREEGQQGPHRTRPQLLVEMLDLLCSRFAGLHFHVLVDGTYSGKSVVGALPGNCDLTGKMLLDAHLFAPPPARTPGQKGASRKKGGQVPSPRQMLAQEAGRKLNLRVWGKRTQVRLVETFFKKIDFRRFLVDLRDDIQMDDIHRIPELIEYGTQMGNMILNDELDRALRIKPTTPRQEATKV